MTYSIGKAVRKQVVPYTASRNAHYRIPRTRNLAIITKLRYLFALTQAILLPRNYPKYVIPTIKIYIHQTYSLLHHTGNYLNSQRIPVEKKLYIHRMEEYAAVKKRMGKISMSRMEWFLEYEYI